MLLFSEAENFVVDGKVLRAVSRVLHAYGRNGIAVQQLLGALARNETHRRHDDELNELNSISIGNALIKNIIFQLRTRRTLLRRLVSGF